jgi:hypothetical protein
MLKFTGSQRTKAILMMLLGLICFAGAIFVLFFWK